MKPIFKIAPYLLIVLMLTNACKSDENETLSPASMTVLKDGQQFEVSDFDNTLLLEQSVGREARRLDLRMTVDGGTFVLTVSNWDWQNPPKDGVVLKSYDLPWSDDCEIIDNFEYCDGGLVSYALPGSSIYSSGFGDTSGVITISTNDPDRKTVSGTFDATVENINDEKIKFSGEFKNVEYRIL